MSLREKTAIPLQTSIEEQSVISPPEMYFRGNLMGMCFKTTGREMDSHAGLKMNPESQPPGREGF